ncbi:hypothetical protein LguiA_025955 [Lonicera macranthoides]
MRQGADDEDIWHVRNLHDGMRKFCQAILPIVASWQSNNISSCDAEFPTNIGRIDKNLLAQQIGSNITGFRPVIDLACMRDVVNKLSSNSKKINPLEHFKTSHGYFIHPQGSKELVGSLETKWKTTNQYLLKEHAWLQCTRRCMFALVPQLNNLLMKKLTALHPSSVTLQLLQNLIINILSFGQCRTSIENTPTTDTGLLSNLHVFLLVHNSHPPPCRLNCLRQQKVENLGDTPSRSHKQVGQAILPIVACWQSNISSCDAEFPTATHIGKIDINLLAWNGMTSWRQFVQERLLLWVRPQPGSSLCVKVASTKVAHFLVFMLVNSDSGTVEKHLNCQEEERYQVLRFKRMEMSASESGESALSDLLKLNTSGGLSKHRYAFLESAFFEQNSFGFGLLALKEAKARANLPVSGVSSLKRRPIFFCEGKTSTSWVSELAVLTFEGTSAHTLRDILIKRQPLCFGRGKSSTSVVNEFIVVTFEGTSGNLVDQILLSLLVNPPPRGSMSFIVVTFEGASENLVDQILSSL